MTGPTDPAAGDIVNRYLQAFYTGHLDRAARLLTPISPSGGRLSPPPAGTRS